MDPIALGKFLADAKNDGEVSPGGEMTQKKFRRVRGSFVRELWSPRVLSRREMTASNAASNAESASSLNQP